MKEPKIDYLEKEKHLQTLIGTPKEFISALLALKLETPHKSPEFETFLVGFAKRHKIDLIAFASEAAESGEDVFRLAYLFRESLHLLPALKAKDIFRLLSTFAVKMENDLNGGLFYDSIRSLPKVNPVIADEIADLILTGRNEKTYGYLNAIYLGILDIDFSRGYQKIRELAGNSDSSLAASGLRGFGLIPSIPSEHKEEVISSVKAAVFGGDERLESSAAFSLCRLSEAFPELREEVTKASKLASPSIQYQIASLLSLKQGKFDDWATACFMNLSGYDLKFKGITDLIDSNLYLLMREKNTAVVIEYLSKWITDHSSDDHRKTRIEKLFDSAVFEIRQNSELLNTITTKWLNADDLKLHHCISELLSYAKVHGSRELSLVTESIEAFTFDDLIYVIRKILGFVFDFDQSISLLFSILLRKPASKQVEDLVFGVLIEHVGYNYPQKTIEFLKGRKFPNRSQSKIAKRTLKELQRRQKKLMDLPRLVELMPHLDDQIALGKQFNKSMAASMEEASKGSIASLFKKVLIKEGRSSFSYYDGKYSQVSKMSHFSQSIEFPRHDVLDVVGASIQRMGFRNVKRGQK